MTARPGTILVGDRWVGARDVENLARRLAEAEERVAQLREGLDAIAEPDPPDASDEALVDAARRVADAQRDYMRHLEVRRDALEDVRRRAYRLVSDTLAHAHDDEEPLLVELLRVLATPEEEVEGTAPLARAERAEEGDDS